MNESNTPTELRAVETLLDSLVRTERASAPTGLESRVFEASRAALSQASVAKEPKAVIARITPSSFRLFTPLRVAAGLALAATVGTIWLAGMRSAVTGPAAGALAKTSTRYDSLDSKVETLLAWNSPMGDGFEGLGEQIDLLYADLTDFSIDAGSSDDTYIDGGAL